MIAIEPFAAPTQAEILKTGVPGLDHVLGGGLVRGSSVLIDGPPGSGKSTLGIRLLHEGVRLHGEAGVMLAFEEFPRQVHQAALDGGIDLRGHEDSGNLRILWTSPQRIVEALQGGGDLLERVMTEMNAQRVLVDSITHFRRVAATEGAMREILGALIQHMKLRGVTTILLKELDTGAPASVAFEEYLVDTSIRLHHAVAAIGTDQESRYLEVRKARGMANAAGLHPFQVAPGGPRVHLRWSARALDAAVAQAPWVRGARMASGTPGLDEAMGGGLLAGTLVLVEGDAGTGRSTMALQAALAGMEAGERVTVILLRESSEAWQRRAEDLVGMPPDCVGERLLIRSIEDGPARLERVQQAVIDAAAHAGPQRIVIDGLADLHGALDDARTDMALFLSRAASRTGALVLATTDRRQRGELQPDDPIRSVADAVIVLLAQREGRSLTRRVIVLKHGGSAHACEMLDVSIGARGLQVEGNPAGDEDEEKCAARLAVVGDGA